MERYIIQAHARVDGKNVILFHEKLELGTRKDVMHVYVPHSTKDRKKALVFYDREEATKMAVFLNDHFYKTLVILK